MKRLMLCSLVLVYCGPPHDGNDGGEDAASDVMEAATFPDSPIFYDAYVPDVNVPDVSDAGVVVDASNDVVEDQASSYNGIDYNGGPVMLGTTNIYLIWYGNWAGDTTTTIVPSLIAGLSGSPYQNIVTSYYMLNGGTKQYISNSLTLAGTYNDNYSQGSALGDTGALAVVNNAGSTHFKTWDPNGIYFVLASSDVTEGQSCSQYCGYHNNGSAGSTDIKWSFILNPAACPSACSYVQNQPTPNSNLGADALASIFTHELGETLTDPLGNAWVTNGATSGEEMGDLCAWNFAPIFTTSNGAAANVSFGRQSFLLQNLWVNASGGYCGLHYP